MGGPGALEQTLQSLVDAHNSRDWDGIRSILTDDFEFIDHRPAGFGTIMGTERFIEFLQAAISLVPDRHMTFIEWFRKAEGGTVTQVDAIAARLLVEGTDEYGSAVEWDVLTVWQAKGGSITRFEAYPGDSMDEAVECARQLREPRAT